MWALIAMSSSGWTVSDANLTPQKHWLSFQLRNWNRNEILKIKSNQKSSSIKDILKANDKFCFHFHTLHKQNPHQIPGYRISQKQTKHTPSFFLILCWFCVFEGYSAEFVIKFIPSVEGMYVLHTVKGVVKIVILWVNRRYLPASSVLEKTNR